MVFRELVLYQQYKAKIILINEEIDVSRNRGLLYIRESLQISKPQTFQ